MTSARWPIFGPLVLSSILSFVPSIGFSDTHYVDISNAVPVLPYTNWITAATNIQDAVDAATNGDAVLVMNGVYDTGGRIGGYAAAIPMNFTNRVTVDKPITLESVNGPEVTLIVGEGPCSPTAVRGVYLGSGARMNGFTVINGHTPDTWLVGDQRYSGGGVYGGVISNCWIKNSRCGHRGGGVAYSTVYNSIISGCCATNPSAGRGGGGGGYYCTMYNSVLARNRAAYGGGGAARDGSLYNCILTNNSAWNMGGACREVSLYNCTVLANSSEITEYGGLYGGGAFNTILWGNLPSGNNFTNDPGFVNYGGGDLHLASNSPCIDVQWNSSAMYAIDPDGVRRPLDGDNDGEAILDLGAYEYVHPAADSDGDGSRDAHEIIAGTDPIDPSDRLHIITCTSEISGPSLSWTGILDRVYTIGITTNLLMDSWSNAVDFVDVPGNNGLMQYTNSWDSDARFYRIQVQRSP